MTTVLMQKNHNFESVGLNNSSTTPIIKEEEMELNTGKKKRGREH